MVSPLQFPGRWSAARNMGTMTLGTAWGDIGSAVLVGGAMRARAFVSLQIHNGTSPQLRLVGLYSATGSAFDLAALQRGTGTITVAGQVYQLADSNQYASMQWDLGGGVPYVKLQARVLGGTAAYVSDARLVTSF